MDLPRLLDRDWSYLVRWLPADFAQSARAWGAWQRPRQIASPEQLLRLLLAYVVAPTPSLRLTAAWAQSCGLASLSQVALLKRLRQARGWLAHLVTQLLLEGVRQAPLPAGPWRLRLVDATSLRLRGSRGTDYRLQVTWDLQSRRLSALELTDVHGGESLVRSHPQPGDLLLADRAYPQRRALAQVRQAGAHFLVRFPWRNLPLLTPEAKPFDLLAALQGLAPQELGDFPVLIAPQPSRGVPALAARVVGLRRSPEAAEQAARQAQRYAKRKGSQVQATTLQTCQFFFLVTSVPRSELSAAGALALYRFRWQVELLFKRLKSLLALDQIPGRDPASVAAYL